MATTAFFCAADSNLSLKPMTAGNNEFIQRTVHSLKFLCKEKIKIKQA